MENETKAWWQSRTIMASLVTILISTLGAFKIYLPEDIQGQLTDALLALVTALSGAATIYGRLKAEKNIAIKPPLPPSGGTGAGLALIFAMSLSLTACETMKTVTPPAPKTPQQAVFLAESQYGVALKVALKYESLPRCGAAAAALCSDAAIVAKIRLSQLAARAALDAAESTVRNPVFGVSAMESAVIAATNAVQAFDKVQLALGVKS